MTEADMQLAIDNAINWVMNVETPVLPVPSAWTDVTWCEYWRSERHKVLTSLDDVRKELFQREVKR